MAKKEMASQQEEDSEALSVVIVFDTLIPCYISRDVLLKKVADYLEDTFEDFSIPIEVSSTEAEGTESIEFTVNEKIVCDSGTLQIEYKNLLEED
jgi:hypothetical protein